MGLFKRTFDYNRDGKLSATEKAIGFAVTAVIMDDMRNDELREGLSRAGLDERSLKALDWDTRTTLLMRSGLDPLDYSDLLGR